MSQQRGRVETTTEERNFIADLAVSVFEVGFDDHRIFEDGGLWCLTKDTCGEHGFKWSGGRNLSQDDLKITQVWSKKQSKTAHLGKPVDKPYYKLGIRFTSWRRKSIESSLALIIHELGHLVRERPPHRMAFWHRIADATQRICERADAIAGELRGGFSPHRLKNEVLNGVRYANADELDASRDEIITTSAKRLDYPADAVGNMCDVGVSSDELAQENADAHVPITEVFISDYETFDDSFVWGQMVKQSPAGFAPDEYFSVTGALPVEEVSDGYESKGTTAEWQAIAVKRIWEHTRLVKGDRVEPPTVPIQFDDE